MKSNADIFDTSHLKADIKGHSVRGGAATIASQGVKLLLQTGSIWVLARKLTPDDYGLIAMVSFFTEFVNLFKDLGLSTATIQKKDITHQQVNTLFWVNVGMSILLALVAAAISPLVARFYGKPELVLITIAIGGTFIFGGLIAQHTALMRRQMRFITLGIIDVASMFIGFFAAIVSAYAGLAYWSLVIMMAARGASNVIMIWLMSPWRPGKPAIGRGVGSMLTFGGSLTGSHIMSYLTRNADNAIIGVSLGSGLLGIYSKAYSLLTLPFNQISTPLQTIMIPALSRLQDEPEQYNKFYLEVLSAVALITMPLVAFLYVSADDIVEILLGSKWAAVAPTFRILAPAAFFSAINFAPGWLFITLGRTGVAFKWNLFCAPLILIGFIIGVRWGINGVAASYSITFSILLVAGLAIACNKSPVRFYDIVKSLVPLVVSSLLAAICASLVVRFVSEINIFIRFVICAIVFGACYFASLLATPAGRGLIRSMFYAILVLRGVPAAQSNADQNNA